MTEVVIAAGDRHAFAGLAGLAEFLVERLDEGRLRLLEQHAILRALGPGDRRLDRAEVELEQIGEDRVRRSLGAIEALRLGVGFDQRDESGRAAGVLKIPDGVVVDRGESAGRAVFRRHVADRGTVLDREVVETGPAELDELVDHAAPAQHLGDGEHEVGRGDAILELAAEAEPDHFGQYHRVGLAEHGGLGLDAADTPAEDRDAIDHRGVGVGADQGVGIGDVGDDRLAVELHLALCAPHRLRQVFEIDLVADAGAGRHHAEVPERTLRPFEEAVALLVLLVFLVDVLLERRIVAGEVDDHRMVDHEVDRNHRVDLVGVAAQRPHGVAHGGEIDHCRHAGEILHQHPGRPERDLMIGALGLEPRRDRLDVVLGDGATVLATQQVLQQHLHRERQPRDAAKPVLLGGREAVIHVGAVADLERLAALEAVERGHDTFHPIRPAQHARTTHNITKCECRDRNAFEMPA